MDILERADQKARELRDAGELDRAARLELAAARIRAALSRAIAVGYHRKIIII